MQSTNTWASAAFQILRHSQSALTCAFLDQPAAVARKDVRKAQPAKVGNPGNHPDPAAHRTVVVVVVGNRVLSSLGFGRSPLV